VGERGLKKDVGGEEGSHRLTPHQKGTKKKKTLKGRVVKGKSLPIALWRESARKKGGGRDPCSLDVSGSIFTVKL